jgi:Tfp pilus assembly protein PilF
LCRGWAEHALPFEGDPLPVVDDPEKPNPPTQTKAQKVANPLNDLLEEAQGDIDKNNFESAIAPLEKVIADQPEFAYAHFQLAYVYTALKRTGEARAAYERAIALEPKMSEAHLNLGMLLLDQDPSAARASLERAVELLPSQSRPRFLLGVAEERSGDLSKAAESFEGALRLDARDLETLLHLGNTYLQLKRPADAETKFRNALAIQGHVAHALLGLAESLEAQKKPEAADAYGRYLALEPADTAARGRLVRILMEGQQHDAALAELDRIDAGKPSLESLQLRADIQIAQRDRTMPLPHSDMPSLSRRTMPSSTAVSSACSSRNATFLPRRRNSARRSSWMARISTIGRTSARRFFSVETTQPRFRLWMRLRNGNGRALAPGLSVPFATIS